MKQKEREHWPTLIIKEGRPYVLKKLERRGINNPCELCDLRNDCGYPVDMTDLVSLCYSDNRDSSWYFEEDWNVFDKPMSDYLIDKCWLNDEERGYHEMKTIYKK